MKGREEMMFRVIEIATGRDVTDEKDWYVGLNGTLWYEDTNGTLVKEQGNYRQVTVSHAALVYTDGYSLDVFEYPSFKSAQEAMKKAFNEYYDPEKDDEEESYCDERTAQVIRDGEERWMWAIVGTAND